MLRYDPNTRVLPAKLLQHPWFTVDRPTKDESLVTLEEETSQLEDVSKIESQEVREKTSKEAQQGADDTRQQVDEIEKVQEDRESKLEDGKDSGAIGKLPQAESRHAEALQANKPDSSRVGLSKSGKTWSTKVDTAIEVAVRDSDEVQMQDASESIPRGWTMTDWARWMRIGFWRLTLMISHGR